VQNSKIGRIIPVFDTLLLLVTIVLGTAGLLYSVQPPMSDAGNDLSGEIDRLMADLAARRREAEELEKRLPARAEQGGPGPDALQTLLQAAASRQEKVVEMQRTLTEIHGTLDGAKGVLVDQHNAAVLENAIAALRAEMERLERQRQELANKITAEDRERAKAQELQKKLEDLRAEMERLRALLAELEAQAAQHAAQKPRRWFGGSYRGPFLLVECDDKGGVVYPGRKRILTENLTAETDWLAGEVRRVGAALLVVRPGGFKEPYAKFYALLTKLAEQGTSQGRTIVLSFWPIEADESIEPYLPEGI
jgi:hypothetical protein